MNDKTPFYELSLAYPLEDLPQVQIARDLSYTPEGDVSTSLDLYLPAGDPPPGGHRLALVVHGGPLVGGDLPWPKEWRVFQDYGRLLAGNGLAAAVLNHRYIGYEGLAQAVGDLVQAARFLAGSGSELGVNGRRPLLWFFSGAGMLLSPFLHHEGPRTAGLIGFYPMFDLTHVPEAQASYSEDELIALSPLSHIGTIPPGLPMLLARAGRDRPGLNRALDTFIKEGLASNLHLEVHNLPDEGHGFDMFSESADARAMIGRAIMFAREHLAQWDE